MRSQHAYNTSCFKITQFFHFFLLLKLLHIFRLYHMLWSRLTSIFYKFPSKLSCLNSHFITLIDSVSQEFRLSWEWLLFLQDTWGSAEKTQGLAITQHLHSGDWCYLWAGTSAGQLTGASVRAFAGRLSFRDAWNPGQSYHWQNSVVAPISYMAAQSSQVSQLTK